VLERSGYFQRANVRELFMDEWIEGGLWSRQLQYLSGGALCDRQRVCPSVEKAALINQANYSRP